MGVQACDQTVHHGLEHFFGDWCEARRLHASDHRSPPNGPRVSVQPGAFFLPRFPTWLLLLSSCCSLGPGDVSCHGHATFSASARYHHGKGVLLQHELCPYLLSQLGKTSSRGMRMELLRTTGNLNRLGPSP